MPLKIQTYESKLNLKQTRKKRKKENKKEREHDCLFLGVVEKKVYCR